MAQHFLLSADAKTLSVLEVMRMTNYDAEQMFKRIRWSASRGRPVCPHCDCERAYECRRPNGSLRFRCKACKKDFSVTSGTLFAFHKLPLQTYLAAIAIFCNEVKGKSALALSRDLGVQYKTAFVLAHKLREAMAAEIRGRVIGGPGRIAEIDGGYFGGYIKPANDRGNRRDRRLARNQNGKRKCVIIIREHDGALLPGVFRSEQEGLHFIQTRIAQGTVVMADESHAWNDLHGMFEMRRINHREAYSMAGACTNGAEGFFSRMRRAETGHHHHLAGDYLIRYAQEASWREDNRRMDNANQIATVSGLALTNKTSIDWCGYWQRSHVR